MKHVYAMRIKDYIEENSQVSAQSDVVKKKTLKKLA